MSVQGFIIFSRLEKAKGMESDHDDPNLSQEIHSKLKTLVETKIPAELKAEMEGKIDSTL